MPRTKDFAAVLRKKLAGDRRLASAIERETLNANIAEQIYAARNAAGLTQKQLADRIGSHQSVVARLEDANYHSHSLAMLKRIAEALTMTLRIEFAPSMATAAPGSRANGQITRREKQRPRSSQRRKARRE